MKKVFLHGEIADIFGSEWELNVKSPRESISALLANNPEIEKYLFEKEKHGITYCAGYENEKPITNQSLDFKSERDIHIFPTPAGSMAMVGSILSTGLSSFAGAFINAKIAKKMKQTFDQKDTETLVAQSKSFLMEGSRNRYTQGSNVPLGYGRLKIGSNVISSTLLNYEYDSKNAKIKNFGDNGSIFGVLPDYKWDEFGGNPRPPYFEGYVKNTSGGTSFVRLEGQLEMDQSPVIYQNTVSTKYESISKLVEKHNDDTDDPSSQVGQAGWMKIDVIRGGDVILDPSEKITLIDGFSGFGVDPVMSTIEFDGMPKFRYQNKPAEFNQINTNYGFGVTEALYGKYIDSDKVAKRTVPNVYRQGNSFAGWLYYEFNFAKSIDKSTLDNWSGKGNWMPNSYKSREDLDSGLVHSYIKGDNATRTSYVCIQSMPVQETNNNILSNKLTLAGKKFYPILFTDSTINRRQQTVGQRWKNGVKKDGIGWHRFESVSIYKSLDLLCEGPIGGFSDKNGETIEFDKNTNNKKFLQAVYLNSTPVMDYKEASISSAGIAKEEQLYNINEFDIEVAANKNNVIGSKDQDLLDNQYVFTANTKTLNEQLFGPRVENRANRIEIPEFIDRISADNDSNLNEKSGGLYLYQKFKPLKSNDSVDKEPELDYQSHLPINSDVMFKYFDPDDVAKVDPVTYYNSRGYNLHVKPRAGDNDHKKYLTELDYDIDELGSGLYRVKKDDQYDRQIYGDLADDTAWDLHYDANLGKFYTPYNGWDEERKVTFNDYKKFIAEDVDVTRGRLFKPGDKMRCINDNGGYTYFEMGSKAERFKGVYSLSLAKRGYYEPGDVVMESTKEIQNGTSNPETESGPLYLITGSHSVLNQPIFNNVDSTISLIGIQIFAIDSSQEDEDGSQSSSFHYNVYNGYQGLERSIGSPTEPDAPDPWSTIRPFAANLPGIVKPAQDITPSNMPHLWEEVLIRSPKEVFIAAAIGDQNSNGSEELLIKDSKGNEIVNMFANSEVIKEVADDTYSKDYFYSEDGEVSGQVSPEQAFTNFKRFLNNSGGSLDVILNLGANNATLETPVAVETGGIRQDDPNVFFLNLDPEAGGYKFGEVNSRWQQEGVINDYFINSEGEEVSRATDLSFNTNLVQSNENFYQGFQIEINGEVRNIEFYNARDQNEQQIGRIMLEEPLGATPKNGDTFYIFKSFSNTEKLEITGTRTVNNIRYVKLQERNRVFTEHNLLVKWTNWENIGESFKATRIEVDEESAYNPETKYRNIGALDEVNGIYRLETSTSNLKANTKEEENPSTHTIIDPLVEQVYVGLRMDQLFYIYPGDEIDITYKIGKTMAKIFLIMGLIKAAGALNGIGLSAVGPVINGGLVPFLIMAFGLGAAYIALKNAQFKIGTRIDNSGELWPNRAKFRIRYGNVGEPFYSTDVYFYGIATSPYVKDVKIYLPPNPNNKDRVIKVYKLNRERNPVEEGEQVYRYKQKMLLSSITEITPTRLNYGNSVVVGTRVNARDIGGSIPERNYHLKLKKVAIPSNYDPELRYYRGNWNGMFKGEDFKTGYVEEDDKSWTDNPAWCLHDLISSKAYGGGKFGIKYENIDKWTLYKIAKYCDQYIPTGFSPKYNKRFWKVSPLDESVIIFDPLDFGDNYAAFAKELGSTRFNVALFYAEKDGQYYRETGICDRKKIEKFSGVYSTTVDGKGDIVYSLYLSSPIQQGQEFGYCVLEVDHPIVEPRYTMNALIMQEQNAFNMINEFAAIFRSYIYWSGGAINFFQDEKKEPVMFFNNTNVSSEGFTYKSTSKVERSNTCKIRYLDKFNEYKPKIQVSEEREYIMQNNIIEQTIEGFGITSRGQAKRYAEFITKTDNLETELVQFSTNQIGAYLRPGDIIEILDNKRTVGRFSGKIKNVRFIEGGKIMNIYIDYPIPSYINVGDESSWKKIKIYNLSEFETIESLNLKGDIGEATDDVISNQRKIQTSSLTVVALSENKEKLTVAADLYEYIPGEFTYHEAVKDAEDRGGQLASITSNNENFLAKIAMPQDDDAVAWIGGYDNDSSDEPKYEWMFPKTINPEIQYFNWMPEYADFNSKSEDGEFFAVDPVPTNVPQLESTLYSVEQSGDIFLIKDQNDNVVSVHASEAEAINQINSVNQVEHGGFLAIKGSLNDNKHGRWVSLGPKLKKGYLLEKKLTEETNLTRYSDIINRSFIIEDAVNLSKPKTFRVLNISEQSNTTYKIEASQYAEEKFDEIEQNLTIENNPSPVIYTERRIEDQEDSIDLNISQTFSEDGEVTSQTINMAFYTDEVPVYFKIKYSYGYEVIATFEVERSQLNRRRVDKYYTHEYVLPEVYDPNLIRADVFLVY